jgi:hypothetical protein
MALLVVGAVVIVAIICFWHLLKIGGGLQLKTPPAPTEKQLEKAIAAREAVKAAEQPAPVREIGSAA